MYLWKIDENIYATSHPRLQHICGPYFLENAWIGKRKEGKFTDEEILELYKKKLEERNKMTNSDNFIVIHEDNLCGEKCSLLLTQDPDNPEKIFYAPSGRYRLFGKLKI